MKNKHKSNRLGKKNIAESVRQRIEAGGDRVWRFADFEGMPFTAVAQTLSRLARAGVVQRLGKGLYYRPRTTVFGASLPNSAQIRDLTMPRKKIFPAGVAAANLLGLTTQNPAHVELATNGSSIPRLIVGKGAVVHTRRPDAWRTLSEAEAAVLDVLRNGGAYSELAPDELVEKLLAHVSVKGRFDRLLKIAASEPPRVRALLGAIGQELGQSARRLSEIRKGLNPLSRFDFGNLIALTHAKEWQAKERKKP